VSTAAVVTMALATFVLVGGLIGSILVGNRRSRRDGDDRPA
jgi:Na+/glutamate symporter